MKHWESHVTSQPATCGSLQQKLEKLCSSDSNARKKNYAETRINYVLPTKKNGFHIVI